MDFSLRFYKEDGKWYADVPWMPKEDNEMVLGADVFLEKLAMGYNMVSLTISDTNSKNSLYSFRLVEHDELGGTYENMSNSSERIWLCNVTHEVCREHPSRIFINTVRVSMYGMEDIVSGGQCMHRINCTVYDIIGTGLMKMESGAWEQSVTYKGPNKFLNGEITMFTKRLSDFRKEFEVL